MVFPGFSFPVTHENTLDRFKRPVLVIAVCLGLMLGMTAIAQSPEMNLIATAPSGSGVGSLLLPSNADVIQIIFPEAEGTYTLWRLNDDDSWSRTVPIEDGPAVSDTCMTALENVPYLHPAAGKVKLIYYTRAGTTRVLVYGHKSPYQ